MRAQITFLLAFALAGPLYAQTGQYKRPERKESAPAAGAKEVKDGKATVPAEAKGDKLDIKELEEKYWAPKDTDFSVVQNRTFTKEHRFTTSLLYGPLINDSFSSGYGLGLVGNYFFDERMGVELSYFTYDTKDNRTTKTFKDELTSGVAPDHGKIQGHYGVAFNWIPFYAKVSLLNSRILYFDMMFSPGVGMISYDRADDGSPKMGEKSALYYSLDVTQLFFLDKWLAFRVDLRNQWFEEEIYSYSFGNKLRDKDNNSTTFLLGFMVLF